MKVKVNINESHFCNISHHLKLNNYLISIKQIIKETCLIESYKYHFKYLNILILLMLGFQNKMSTFHTKLK